MVEVTISVIGMSDVVRGLEQGIETLRASRSSLRATLDRFDLDTSPTVRIGQSVDWALNVLPGVRRRYAMAQVLEGSVPSWLAGTAVFDEDTISTLDPDLALAQGKETAAALRDGRGEPDEELLARLEANMGDPYFASGFAAGVTPDELAAIVVRLSGSRAPADGFLDADELAKRNAWYGRALTAMSTTLGTATRATGDLALPPGYAQSWVEQITAEVSGAQFPDGTGQVDHANALGALLGAGTFSLAFLGTVSEGVYDYERSFQNDHRGAVWAPRSGDPSTRFVVYDATGQIFRDPMAGIMSALGKNPAAAQNFFSGGESVTVKIDGVDRQVSDRLKYLVQDRTWAVDATNGASLGVALAAATTKLRNQNGTGRTSAEIAAQTFALIGARTEGGWQMWDGLRPSVATMLASYATDLHRVFDDTKPEDLGEGMAILVDGPEFPPGMPYGARMNVTLIERIIGTLGQDERSTNIVLAGVTAANNLSMSTRFAFEMKNQDRLSVGQAVLEGTSVSGVDNSVRDSAMLLGWAVKNAYQGAKDDEELVKKRQEMVAAVLSAASSLPFIPTIKPELVQWTLDQAKDQALERIKNGVPQDADARFTSVDGKAPASCRDQVMNLLLAAGYFGPQSYDGPGRYTPPPEAVIIAGDPPRFDLNSQGYVDWQRNDGPNAFLDTRVTGPYDSMWSNLQ